MTCLFPTFRAFEPTACYLANVGNQIYLKNLCLPSPHWDYRDPVMPTHYCCGRCRYEIHSLNLHLRNLYTYNLSSLLVLSYRKCIIYGRDKYLKELCRICNKLTKGIMEKGKSWSTVSSFTYFPYWIHNSSLFFLLDPFIFKSGLILAA